MDVISGGSSGQGTNSRRNICLGYLIDDFPSHYVTLQPFVISFHIEKAVPALLKRR
jgi:hypothetical protein